MLANIPIKLREKQLKAALGRGVRVMAKEARRTAPVDELDDDDIHIRKNIRTGTTVKGKIVSAWCRVSGMAAAYAIALEYGHWVHVGDVKTEGRAEEAYFWRPAIDTTEAAQDREVIRYLRHEAQELARH